METALIVGRELTDVTTGELSDEELDQATGGLWWLLGGAAVMGAMYVWSWFQDESYQ